jgi:hypothetical protein
MRNRPSQITSGEAPYIDPAEHIFDTTQRRLDVAKFSNNGQWQGAWSSNIFGGAVPTRL